MPVRTTDIPPALDGVVLVLDRPRDVTNVGGVVRAMGNFGLTRLRLVEPAAYDSERVLAMAHRGAPVLQRLERHATLDAALADCGFVLGTTARPRAVRHERLTPRQAAPALLCAASRDPATPAAVLFGPEDRGLSNAALGRCNAVVTIPTAPDDPSLNLAQSALVIAYELWLAATTGAAVAHVPDAVAALLTAPTTEPLAQGAARNTTPETYRIGPEDLLQISVWKNEALTRVVTVRPDGKISLPLLHDVQASGLTALELRDVLAAKFAEYIPSPEVAVIVSEVRSFKVSVIGEVAKPGRFELKSSATVLDALALAGGFTQFVSRSRIVILHADGKRVPFNFNKLAGEQENFLLRNGDVVLVP